MKVKTILYMSTDQNCSHYRRQIFQCVNLQLCSRFFFQVHKASKVNNSKRVCKVGKLKDLCLDLLCIENPVCVPRTISDLNLLIIIFPYKAYFLHCNKLFRELDMWEN